MMFPMTRLLALAILLAQPIHMRADEAATCAATTSCRTGSFCNAEPGLGQNGTCAGCDGYTDDCFASNLTAAGADSCFRSCYCAVYSGAQLHVNGGAVKSLPLTGGFVGSAAGPLVDVGLGTEDASAYAGGNNISGSICLIERGGINFHKKIAHCQANGGIGAVIFNNQTGPIGSASAGEGTSIPSVTVSMDEGEKLKTDAIGATATLRVCGRGIVTVAQVIAAKMSGSLSMICSLFIIRNIFKKWRTSRSNEHLPTSTRVVLSMSVAELGSSFWAHVMSTWLMPQEPGVPFAAGNSASCSAQAFLWQFFLFSGAWSNALLAVAFWLIVNRKMPEFTLRKWYYQFPLLGWPWVFGLAIASINIIFEGSGSMDSNIWFCSAWAGKRALATCAIVLGLGLLIIVFSMGSLIRDMYLIEKKMGRYQHGEDSANTTQTLEVSKQGISYIVAYLVIFIPAAVLMLVSHMIRPSYDWLYLVFACVFPLQGFLNALVFFRPKFAAARKRQGESGSKVGALLQVLDVTLPGFMTNFATSFSSVLGRSRELFRRTSTGPSVTQQRVNTPQVGEISGSVHNRTSVTTQASRVQEVGEVEDRKGSMGSENNAPRD